MQFQANQLQVPIARPVNLDSTALGAAYLAGLGVGLWDTLEDLENLNPIEAAFSPEDMNPEDYASWKRAVQATIDFAQK
jgi:glycerol kinase